MQSELKLESCPFCGEAESLYVMHYEGTIKRPAYLVRCDNCGASGPTTDKGTHVEDWNRRAGSDALRHSPVYIDRLHWIASSLREFSKTGTYPDGSVFHIAADMLDEFRTTLAAPAPSPEIHIGVDYAAGPDQTVTVEVTPADQPERGELRREERPALTDAELSDPEYMRSYVDELWSILDELVSVRKPEPVDEEAFKRYVKSRGGDVMKREGRYVHSMTRLWDDCWRAALATAGVDDRKALHAEIEQLRAERNASGVKHRRELMTLQARVKSLEGLVAHYRAKDGERLEAVNTLESERAANAKLTAELADSSRLAEAVRKANAVHVYHRRGYGMLIETERWIEIEQALAQYEGKEKA